MNIHEKLLSIQQELKAPKTQTNTFGGFNYRSCEDILEAVKPLLKLYNCNLLLTDEVVNVGARYYVKATAKLIDVEAKEETTITNTAFAREAESKPKMDDSQVTGTASSYARKYALNGLFLIDDTKDADTDDFTRQTGYTKITSETMFKLKELAEKQGKEIDMNAVSVWTQAQAEEFLSKYDKNGNLKGAKK